MTDDADQAYADVELEIILWTGVEDVDVRVTHQYADELHEQFLADGVPASRTIELSNAVVLELVATTISNPAVLALLGTSLATFIRRNRPKRVTFSKDGVKSTEGMSGREVERLLNQQADLRKAREAEQDDE